VEELKVETLLAMNIAATLTQAACADSGGSLPVSADLSDNNVRAKNLQVWETFRVFYAAVVGAQADAKDWPPPQVQAGSLLPNLLQSLTPLLTGAGPLASVAQGVLALLPKPQAPAAPSAPLPNPGQTPTPAK
jgi:hypothetical protein